MLGLVTGGAVAGIATLLSAPNSGPETRLKLLERKNILAEELSELKQNLGLLKSSISTASIEGKEGIREFITDVRLALQNWKIETTQNKQNLSKELQEIEQTIEELEKTLTSQPN